MMMDDDVAETLVQELRTRIIRAASRYGLTIEESGDIIRTQEDSRG